MEKIKVSFTIKGYIKRTNNRNKSKKEFNLFLDESATLSDALKLLSIEKNSYSVIVINNSLKNLDYNLKDGDKAIIYSIIVGG